MKHKKDFLDKIIEKTRKDGLRFDPLIAITLFTSLVFLLWILWGPIAPFVGMWAGAVPIDAEQGASRTSVVGAWGDSFGGFNALVGALGFVAIGSTLFLQYKAFEAQRQERKFARFEENFFHLLGLLRELRGNLVYEHTSKFKARYEDVAPLDEVTGHDAIEAAYREVNHWTFKSHDQMKVMRRSIIGGQYNNYVQSRYEFCFAPYFRIIYTILYRIKYDDNLNLDDKYYYGNILRSQLTSFEVGLLAFNATSEFSKDLDDLIEYFRLLKYLPQKRRRVIAGVFNPAAYLERS